MRAVVDEARVLEFKDGRVVLEIAPDLMTAAGGVQDEIRELIGKAWSVTARPEFRPRGASAHTTANTTASASVPANSSDSVPGHSPRAIPTIPTIPADPAARPAARDDDGLSGLPSPRGAEIPTMTIASAADHPLVRRAVELLGAKVVGVYPRQTRANE